MSKSIFTQIIDREIPADIVFENDRVIAINDINPQAPVHILIIPKKEIATINDIEPSDSELIAELFIIANKLAKENKIDRTGFRTIFN